MGIFSSIFGSKSKSTQNIDQTAQRFAPDWIQQPTQRLVGDIDILGGANPQSFVAGVNPLQSRAGDQAAGLMGTPWNFDAAADLTRGVAGASAPRTQGVRAKGYIDDYQNPYLKDVVDAAMADYDFGAGQSRAQFDLDNATAFGGSGVSLAKAATEDALTRGRGTLSSGLRSDAFNTALNAAQADAQREQNARDLNAQLYAGQMDRTLGAADQLANISSQFGGEQRANIGAQASMGDLLRQIEQEQRQAPIDLLKTRADLLKGSPIDMFGGLKTTGTTTTKTKNTPSLMSSAGDIATIAALFASDRRLKTDIVKLYERPDGLGVYLYRYLWSPLRFIGVMAQEVLAVKPEAVVALPSGFLAVDYGRL